MRIPVLESVDITCAISVLTSVYCSAWSRLVWSGPCLSPFRAPWSWLCLLIRISEEDYVKAIETEITNVVKLQESLDLDVLVHGEPEVSLRCLMIPSVSIVDLGLVSWLFILQMLKFYYLCDLLAHQMLKFMICVIYWHARCWNSWFLWFIGTPDVGIHDLCDRAPVYWYTIL